MNYYIDENGHAVRCSDDSLMHYGVLGMKWGKRKAQKYETKARYARESAKEWDEIRKYQTNKVRNKYQKKFEKDGDKEWLEIGEAKAQRKEERYKKAAEKDRADASKYAAKAKKTKAKHEKLAGKETFKRVSNASAGKTVAQALVFGTYGAVKYNQARTRGASRGKAAVEALLYKAGNRATSGILGIAEPRMNDKGKK